MMPKRLLAFLCLALLLTSTPVYAALEAEPPIALECKSALLLEPDSGQVVFEKNADERVSVASVTKIMPILLACEAIEQGRATLSDMVSISPRAAGMGGSQVLLEAGEQQSVSALLKSMIVASANDATVALAEFLFGSEQAMVQRMNERARELGMTNSNFVNATGLPAANNVTTARDVATMARALVRHALFFDYSSIWMDVIEHPGARVTELTNTNRLTRLYDGCDGIKTGSTNEAGYCMAASASRGGMRLIAVVLGAETSKQRFSVAGAMMDYGFANYRKYAVAEQGARVRGKLPIDGGDRQAIDLMLGEDLTLLIAKGEEQDIELIPALPERLAAPIAEGERVGDVEVILNGRLVGKVPVVAAETVERRGYFDGWRMLIRRWLYSAS